MSTYRLKSTATSHPADFTVATSCRPVVVHAVNRYVNKEKKCYQNAEKSHPIVNICVHTKPVSPYLLNFVLVLEYRGVLESPKSHKTTSDFMGNVRPTRQFELFPGEAVVTVVTVLSIQPDKIVLANRL